MKTIINTGKKYEKSPEIKIIGMYAWYLNQGIKNVLKIENSITHINWKGTRKNLNTTVERKHQTQTNNTKKIDLLTITTDPKPHSLKPNTNQNQTNRK